MENYNYNDKKKLLQLLAEKSDYGILEVEIQGRSNFFLANTFEKASVGNIQSAPYFEIRGKDVTDFINNYTTGPNAEILINNLRGLDEREKDVVYQFSDNHTWRYFKKY